MRYFRSFEILSRNVHKTWCQSSYLLTWSPTLSQGQKKCFSLWNLKICLGQCYATAFNINRFLNSIAKDVKPANKHRKPHRLSNWFKSTVLNITKTPNNETARNQRKKIQSLNMHTQIYPNNASSVWCGSHHEVLIDANHMQKHITRTSRARRRFPLEPWICNRPLSRSVGSNPLVDPSNLCQGEKLVTIWTSSWV